VDLFTHIVIAYLVSFGVVGGQPQYLAAGALAGGLPDGDILFFPLARRFPILRHHGITHSILGVTIVAVVGGYFLAPMLAAGSPLVYFVVMELGGLAHMVGDGFTHFSVPPLLPFSDRRLELDADRAINLLTLVVSVFAFWLLLSVERGHVAYSVYLATVWALAAFYAAYFGARLLARFAAGRAMRRLGGFQTPVPTGNPLAWLLLSERKEGGRLTTRFARFVLGKGIVAGPFEVSAPLAPSGGGSGVPATEQEALDASYPLARAASSMLEETYHFGEAHREGNGWLATWYSLEFSAFGRSAAVRVRLGPDAPPKVSRAWHTPLWRKELA
jgi:membrane-bound metal-dependent hydrolase YbcI (DUF457 family)